MKCLNPVWVKYPLEVKIEKMRLLDSKGIKYSSRDSFVNGIYAPCGKCAVCKERRKSAWMLRNILEYKKCDSAFFFTLTYADEHLPLKKCSDGSFLPVVSKRDIQLFLKRLRKSLYYKIRYFIVSEYGPTTLRPHYHGIIYNIHLDDIEKIDKAWSNGFVKVDPVTHGRIAYCSSYCFDDLDLTPEHERNFLLASRNPAIGGINVIDDSVIDYIRSNYTGKFPISSDSGETFFYRIPKYLMEKIFSVDERFEISVDSYKQNLKSESELNKKQLDWVIDKLERYGSDFFESYDLIGFSPDSLDDLNWLVSFPISNSPKGLIMQKGDEITRRCLEKRKMNKGKTPYT